MDALVNYSSDDDQDDSGTEISAPQQWSSSIRTLAKDKTENDGGGHALYNEKSVLEHKRLSQSDSIRKNKRSRRMSSTTDSDNSLNSADSQREYSANKKSTTPPPINKYCTTTRNTGGIDNCAGGGGGAGIGGSSNGDKQKHRYTNSNRDEDINTAFPASSSSRRHQNESGTHRGRDTKEAREAKNVLENTENNSIRRKHKSERDNQLRAKQHATHDDQRDAREDNCSKRSGRNGSNRDGETRARDDRKCHKYNSYTSAKERYDDPKRNNRDHYSSSSFTSNKNSSNRYSDSGGRRYQQEEISSHHQSHQSHRHHHNHHHRRSYEERSQHKHRRNNHSRSRSRSGSRSSSIPTSTLRSSKYEHRQRRDSRSKSCSRSRSRSQSPVMARKNRQDRTHLERGRFPTQDMERKSISNSDNKTSEGVMRSLLKIGSASTNTAVPLLSTTSNSTANSNASNIVPLMSLKFPDSSLSGTSTAKCLNPNSSHQTPANTNQAGNGDTQQNTGVQLPSYYNPSVINLTRYADQLQKRKLLWGSKKTEESASKWGNAQFSQDSDGKVASKFMRLMGIKNANNNGASADAAVPNETEKPTNNVDGTNTASDVQTRERMFSSMEKQYEVARQATHTMRGVGLGFGTQPRTF